MEKSEIRFRISIHLFFFFNLSIISSCASYYSRFSPSKTPHIDYCNSLVPKSAPTGYTNYSASNYPDFVNGYYIGKDQPINPQSSQNSPQSVSFSVTRAHKTSTKDVVKLYGILSFRSYYNYRSWDPQFPVGAGLTFYLEGFWSESSGKLCMVGSGTAYSSEGNSFELSVVFKLNHPKNSTIVTSLVSGTLESVNRTDTANYFEPIPLLGFSQLNYEYTLNWNGNSSLFSGEAREMKGLALGSVIEQGMGMDICSVLQRGYFVFDLEYTTACKNCSPIGNENEVLPSSMSFSEIQCSENRRLRMLIGFYNGSFTVYDQPLAPKTMLVGEGVWDEKNNQLRLVVCRIMNVTGSLADVSVGDCSIRLVLWFPAILSIKTRSSVVGQIWNNRTMGEFGYFDRIRFQSTSYRSWGVSGLKYEYTQISTLSDSCMEGISTDKGKGYPGANSQNLKFDMKIRYDQQAWGYGTPLTIGDQFYEASNSLPSSSYNKTFLSEPAGEVSGNQSIHLNVSYTFTFTPPSGSKMANPFSLDNVSQSSNNLVQIAAEGIYDTGSGCMWMLGCLYLGSNYHKSTKKNTTDCDILISVQFPALNAKRKKRVQGFIKSFRDIWDPLYFEPLNFTSLSLSEEDALESVWRMELETTMVLIADTLFCTFLGSQLFYMKKHPDVDSISLLMLVILTFGHIIPPVFNQGKILGGTSGWLEVNELMIRVTSLLAILLQFYLLLLILSKRLGHGGQIDFWLAEMKALFVFLPFCLLIGFIAWLMHESSRPYETPDHDGFLAVDKYRQHSSLLLDAFLLPQILLNVFWNSKDKALSPAFYFGTTVVHLLPHVYGIFQISRFTPYYDDQQEVYANPGRVFWSYAWDFIIPCGGLLLAITIYFQQHLGGSCILPLRFRAHMEYEEVSVVTSASSATDDLFQNEQPTLGILFPLQYCSMRMRHI